MGSNVIKRILLSLAAFVLSALMLTLIQPPFNVAWLAWIALVPFVLVCSTNKNVFPSILICYLISLFYWCTNLYWIGIVTAPGWIAFCLYITLLWPILFLAIRYCRTKKITLVLAVPLLIVGAERLQGVFLGGFFWRFLAHSQYANIPLIQIADIFGAAGVSFVIAMVNGFIAELLIEAQHKRLLKAGNFLKTGAVLLIVAAVLVYGRWRITESEKFVKDGPLVASVQLNVPQQVKDSADASVEIFEEMLLKSGAAASVGAELIIWPETMVQAMLNPEVLRLLGPKHNYNKFDQAIKAHSGKGIYVLAGASSGNPAVKENGRIELTEKYNSAFLYKPDGTQAEKRYDKTHLVPFGEVVPFKKSAPWLHKLLMGFTPYDFDYSLDSGSEYTIFEVAEKNKQNYKFGVLICYEDTVPKIARTFALDNQGRKRLDWLVNISNDGWFVRFKDDKILPSTELEQHTVVCVFRAVENRLAIVRSVNTGISCLIDPVGRIRNGFAEASDGFSAEAMQRKGIAGWFVDNLPIDSRRTFFSRYGQWLDSFCAFCLVFAVLTILKKEFVKRRNKRKAK